MTDQHRATPEQWRRVTRWAKEDKSSTDSCILELHARIEALEAAQQDKLDRLIALDAAASDCERAATNMASCPSVDRIPDFTGAAPITPEEARSLGFIPADDAREACKRAANAAATRAMEQLSVRVDGMQYWPVPAQKPLKDTVHPASAEAQPAGSLLEMVANAIYNVPHDSAAEARAAIREVATWLDRFALHGSGEYAQAAKVLRQEVGQ